MVCTPGKREITEKTFDYDYNTTAWLAATVVGFPGFCYFLCKGELNASKNTCINNAKGVKYP